MDISFMDALTIAVTIVGALITFATGYEKLIVKPKEKKREEQQRKFAKMRDEERRELVEIRKKEYDQLIQTIKEAFRPHTEKLAETERRVDVIEVKTKDHDQRIFVLERENGIGDFKYVERFTGKEKD